MKYSYHMLVRILSPPYHAVKPYPTNQPQRKAAACLPVKSFNSIMICVYTHTHTHKQSKKEAGQMTSNKLIEIEGRLDEMLVAHIEAASEYRELIKVAQKAADTARGALIEAEKRADKEGFTRAAQEKRKAESEIEEYRKQIARLHSEPVITPEGYDTIGAAIMEELDRLSAAAEKKVGRLIAEIQSTSEELNANISYGNQVLEKLQIQLAKIEPVTITNNGNKLPMEHLRLQYRERDLEGFCKHIEGTKLYKRVTTGRRSR